MNDIKSLFWLLISLGIIAIVRVAIADSSFTDDVPIEELMEVNVTSITKMAMPLNKSPVSAFVISQDEISRKGYRFLIDILKNTPDFHVANLASSEKAITEIYVRGVFANDKITILIDGHRMKPSTGEPVTFYSSIPLIDVKQVEISLGSASSIYGADAMLATINLVTENVEHLNGIKVKATGGTQDTGEIQVATGTKINKDIAVSLSGSFHHSAQENLKKNYSEIYGNINDIDLTEQSNSVYFKGNYKGLMVSYYRVEDKNNNGLSFNPNQPMSYDYSGKAFWDITNQMANATYNLEINPFWQVKSCLDYVGTELSPDSSYRSWGVTAPISWSGNTTRLSETVAYLHGNINWLSGVELSFMNSQPKNQYTDPRLPKYDINYQNYAVYSQLNYDVTKTLAVNGSLRMDADSRYSPGFNPRLGFSWQAIKTLRFFGAWGTSYLTPSPYLIYETWNMSTDSIFQRPNTNLRPERLQTYELGFNAEPFKSNTLKASVFYNDGKDVIRIVDNAFTGMPNYNANIASLKTYGFQLTEQQSFANGLSVDVNYTLTKGKQDSENLDHMVNVTNVPEHMIKSNLMYSLDKFTFRLTGRWFDRIYSNESNTIYNGASMHGVTIFDTNLHYSRPFRAAEWSVDLGATNLLDTKYYTIGVNDNFSGGLPRLPQETRRLYLTVGLSY